MHEQGRALSSTERQERTYGAAQAAEAAAEVQARTASRRSKRLVRQAAAQLKLEWK